jgi:methyl-accepting chemotaxis protein
MQKGIERIRQVSVQTVDTMEAMFREVTDMEGSFNRVMRAVKTQADKGGRILTSLTTLRGTSNQVGTGSRMIKQESGSIHGIVEDLKDLSTRE